MLFSVPVRKRALLSSESVSVRCDVKRWGQARNTTGRSEWPVASSVRNTASLVLRGGSVNGTRSIAYRVVALGGGCSYSPNPAW